MELATLAWASGKVHLSEMAKQEGWKASQETRSKNARLRQMGMFNDLAKFIMDWRLTGGTSKYPPDAKMRDYLDVRGWRAERGGKVSVRTVQEMIHFMDPKLDALPTASDARVAESRGEIIPGTEAIYFGFSPEDWLEFREAVMGGWEPASRNAEANNHESAGDDPTKQP